MFAKDPNMFVPDLMPLVDPQFATNDEQESKYALKALGEVVEEYYAVTGKPQRRKKSDEQWLDMYVENEDGGYDFYPLAVDELIDWSKYDYNVPDVPLSPNFPADDWVPEHCFFFAVKAKKKA